MRSRIESGYVLLSMLVFMMSVGAGLMSVVSGNALYDSAPNAISEHDRRGLVNARQSMLSYAVLYPYLYGPTGAGPAHFPCPDTDGFRESDVEPQSAKKQRRDGPNPPCASLAGSEGMLPRHIALPGYRYLFHSQSRQRYDYTVVGDSVNNPLNRVVNLDQLVAQFHQPVATIRLPSSNNKKAPARVTITNLAVAKATVASVSAWVIQRSARLRSELCLRLPDDTVPVQTTTDVRTCNLPDRVKVQCKSDELLNIVLDMPAVVSGDCLVDSLDVNTIEGVPAIRHWFVRNKWYPSFTLTTRDECDTEQSLELSCLLTLPTESLRAATEHRALIKLYWVRSS